MKKILCALLCLGMMLGCTHNNNEKQTVQKSEETVEEKKLREYKEVLEKHKNYKNGTYQVGKDFDAGEYCLFSNNLDNISNSYEVRKNEYSNGDDYIYSDQNFLNSYIHLKKGEYIEIDGATMFSINDMPEVHKNFPYAVIKVGKDIESGNYIIKPLNEDEHVINGGTYYAIMDPIGEYGDRNDIAKNDLDFTTDKKVKLKKNQYLKIQNCTFEKAK